MSWLSDGRLLLVRGRQEKDREMFPTLRVGRAGKDDDDEDDACNNNECCCLKMK